MGRTVSLLRSVLLRVLVWFGLFSCCGLAPAFALTCSASPSTFSMAFGTVDYYGNGGSFNASGQTNLTISCSGGPVNGQVNLCIQSSYGIGALLFGRAMRLGGASNLANGYVAFGLYTDAAHTIPWGSFGIGGVALVQPTGWSALGSTPGSIVPASLALNAAGSGSVTYTVYGSTTDANSATTSMGTYYWGTLDGPTVIYGTSSTLPACTAAGIITASTISLVNTTSAATITLAPSCSVTTADLAIGTQDASLFQAAGGLKVTGTNNITVNCLTASPFTVGIALGTKTFNGQTATFAARLMPKLGSTTDSLTYAIYSDSNYATLWGDGTGGSTLYSNTGFTGGTTSGTFPIYVRFPQQTPPSTGTYSDTVVVTVTY